MIRIVCLFLVFATACESPSAPSSPPASSASAAPLAAPAPTPPAQPEKQRGPFDPPDLREVVKLYDASNGARFELDGLLDALATHEVVFFGESHLDETTHRLELAVYLGLIERTQGKVVLAMEMFERDVQPTLDAYLRDEIDETEFVHKARAWSNYRTGYRALIETAKAKGLPVVASNAPAALRRKVGFGGKEALDNLPPEQRALLPEKLLPNTDAYWERFARVVRGHMGMIAGTTPERRLTSGQSLWDNSMGESCVRALAAHPGHVVLHVNGGFHSKYREGAVTQLLARRPDTRVAVLEAIAVTDLPGVAAFQSPRADYLAAVDGRARGVSEGFHAVTMAPELRYRVWMPKGKGDVPLLVWLSDEPFRARDGLAFWNTAIGEEAAIVAIEPPYPHVTGDRYRAGRWFWSETLREDLGTLTGALPRVVAYVLRHYPVDRDRVLLAGEGAGATVLAALDLYTGLDLPTLAVEPRRHTGLRGLALPEPRDPGTPLTVFTADRDWWDAEAKERGGVGRPVAVEDAPASGWELFVRTEDFIRETLGLAARPAPEGEPERLVLKTDTPRARFWAHRLARRAGASVAMEGEGVALACLGEAESAAFGPAIMQDGRNLPLAPGPFGGTTVLYVPKGRTEEQRAAWQALEDADVLKKRSRFAHLRVVFEGDEEDNLAAVLQDTKDRGRSNVLIVPAVFCATAKDMSRWAEEAAAFEDILDISWLPGLGGSMRLPE